MHANVIGGIFSANTCGTMLTKGSEEAEALLPRAKSVRQILFKRGPDAMQSKEQMHANVIGGIFLGQYAWHDADEG